METQVQTPYVEDEVCHGKCKHSKGFHVVRMPETTALACARVDCACMEYVPKPKPVEA
jgi:hypothetical protein